MVIPFREVVMAGSVTTQQRNVPRRQTVSTSVLRAYSVNAIITVSVPLELTATVTMAVLASSSPVAQGFGCYVEEPPHYESS